MPLERAYSKPAALSAVHPASRAARKPPSDWVIGLILALGCDGWRASPAPRQTKRPPNLARQIAHQESETQAARNEYTYRQTVVFAELDAHGAATGEYREERDVIFSPAHERTEQIIGKPLLTLKRLKMTDEDFQDIRGIQPFVMTEDQLWNYETKFRGDETIDGVDCWVLQVRPRQILQGQRLFDGHAVGGQEGLLDRAHGRAGRAADAQPEIGEPVSAIHHRSPAHRRPAPVSGRTPTPTTRCLSARACSACA